MHTYQLEYIDQDGSTQNLEVMGLTPAAALARALEIAPGRCAVLRDEHGEICRLERMSDAAVWRIAHMA